MSNPAMTQTRVRLLYRAISMAMISAILATPVALFISYKFSKARYDRIVERQVNDFRQILFHGDFGPNPRITISDRITVYLNNIPRRQEKDASLVYISIADEFGQKVADQNFQSADGHRFRVDDITLCLNSFIPILSFGGERYFCARVDLSNGRNHYGFFGILRVSDNVISDFIANSVVMCLLTFLFAISVSALQYYVSLKVSKTLIKANVKTLFLLGNTIALRDNDTFHHNLRVMIYSYYLGKTSGLSDEKLNDLINGALLHDIGKIGIPDAVLQKPGKLTPEEFEVIKEHVGLGEKIMLNSEWIDRAIDIIKHHHERYDGTGYPGLCILASVN